MSALSERLSDQDLDALARILRAVEQRLATQNAADAVRTAATPAVKNRRRRNRVA